MDRTETTRSRWRKMKINAMFLYHTIYIYRKRETSASPRRPPGCNEESPSIARGSIYFREKCLPPSFALWFGPTCLWNGSCRARGERTSSSSSSCLFPPSLSFTIPFLFFSFLFFSFFFLSRPFPPPSSSHSSARTLGRIAIRVLVHASQGN